MYVCRISWIWNYKQLWATMCELGLELGSLGRTASALWSIGPPAPGFIFILDLTDLMWTLLLPLPRAGTHMHCPALMLYVALRVKSMVSRMFYLPTEHSHFQLHFFFFFTFILLANSFLHQAQLKKLQIVLLALFFEIGRSCLPCSPGGPQTCCIDQADLKLPAFLLTLPPCLCTGVTGVQVTSSV